MSNSKNIEVPVQVVEVSSSSSTFTSVGRMTDDSSSTSSEENVGTRVGNLLELNDGILVVPRVQASISGSFDGLTIPVAVPFRPKLP